MLTEPLAIRVPKEIKEQLEIIARERFCSVADVARDAFRLYLANLSDSAKEKETSLPA